MCCRPGALEEGRPDGDEAPGRLGGLRWAVPQPTQECRGWMGPPNKAECETPDRAPRTVIITQHIVFCPPKGVNFLYESPKGP